MRGFRNNSKLGKCTFCAYTITEGEEKLPSKFAKITYGKWICGNCLYGMRDAVDSVIDEFDEVTEKANINLKNAGYQLDPETGKLVSYKYPVDIEEPR